MRTFASGATRDGDDDKPDYEGFLSPFVLEAYAAYMHRNRVQVNGEKRSSDNWRKGMDLDAYMKSLLRHVFELWRGHRSVDWDAEESIDTGCAIMFNIMGYVFECIQVDFESTQVNETSPRPDQSRDQGDEGDIEYRG